MAGVVFCFVFARLRRRAAAKLTAMGVLLHSPWSGRRTLECGQQSELAALIGIAYADDDAMPAIATAAPIVDRVRIAAGVMLDELRLAGPILSQASPRWSYLGPVPGRERPGTR